MTPKIKNIIIVLVVLVLLILVYIFVIKKSPEEDALISTTPASPDGTIPTDSPADQDFLTVLLGVRNLTLNGAIFSNPAFKSLIDNSVSLSVSVDNTPGRPNPFAPIGSDSTSSPFPGSSSPTPLPTETTTPPTTPAESSPTSPLSTPPLPPATP